MMKYEFEEKLHEIEPIQRTVSGDDYKLIEYVYTYHPSISDTEGKRQVALLYHEFGIQIFKDMEAAATANQVLESTIRKTRAELQKLLIYFEGIPEPTAIGFVKSIELKEGFLIVYISDLDSEHVRAYKLDEICTFQADPMEGI